MPHGIASVKVPIKRSCPGDVKLPATKRLQAAMNAITIEDEDEEIAEWYTSQRSSWPPQGMPYNQGGQGDANLRTPQRESQELAKSRLVLSLLIGREVYC